MEKKISNHRTSKHDTFVKIQDDTNPRRVETKGERSKQCRDANGDR